MAEKKNDSELVVTAPLVIAKLKSGQFQHLYEGAQVSKDSIDADHLKMLQDDGLVGSPDDK